MWMPSWEPSPENLDPASRDLIRGVYKLKDRLLLVLDDTSERWIWFRRKALRAAEWRQSPKEQPFSRVVRP
jgi:hypothetical protein